MRLPTQSTAGAPAPIVPRRFMPVDDRLECSIVRGSHLREGLPRSLEASLAPLDSTRLTDQERHHVGYV